MSSRFQKLEVVDVRPETAEAIVVAFAPPDRDALEAETFTLIAARLPRRAYDGRF